MIKLVRENEKNEKPSFLEPSGSMNNQPKSGYKELWKSQDYNNS
jgi:hypothetical protein